MMLLCCSKLVDLEALFIILIFLLFFLAFKNLASIFVYKHVLLCGLPLYAFEVGGKFHVFKSTKYIPRTLTL